MAAQAMPPRFQATTKNEKTGITFTSAKLVVPPNAPIKLFWSVTVYDVDTRALILNDQKIADRSSRMALRKNADGSEDVYCGAEGAGRLREKLDPDYPRPELVRIFAVLPADRGLLRSVLAVAGLRAGVATNSSERSYPIAQRQRSQSKRLSPRSLATVSAIGVIRFHSDRGWVCDFPPDCNVPCCGILRVQHAEASIRRLLIRLFQDATIGSFDSASCRSGKNLCQRRAS